MRNSITPATIIPIASGKGGVGKSFICANLGAALADLGKDVIVADLDFGGSNLHSFLGLDNTFAGIGDFLRARHGKLAELLVPAPYPHFRFLAGDVRSPFMANMPHAQKMRLINNLKKLECEFLLLDLGSGSSFNTLDFFGLSNQGLLIATPEFTSMMNMLTFLKHFAFRVIERSLPRNTFLKNTLKRCYNQSVADRPVTVSRLLSELSAVNREAAQTAAKIWSGYRPRIVFNQGEHPDELGVLNHLLGPLDKNLSLEADFIGFLFFDSAAATAMRKRKPLKDISPTSPLLEDIQRLADRLVRLWDQPLKNSAALLRKNTESIYKLRSRG